MTKPEPDCIFTFCPNKQGRGTWTDLTVTGARMGAQPVCEQHWRALRFIPTREGRRPSRSTRENGAMTEELVTITVRVADLEEVLDAAASGEAYWDGLKEQPHIERVREALRAARDA